MLHDRITQLDDVTRAWFLAAKAADGTRPVIDASGCSRRVAETDVWDAHTHEQDPAAFAKQLPGLAEGVPSPTNAHRQALLAPLPRSALLHQRVRRHPVGPGHRRRHG